MTRCLNPRWQCLNPRWQISRWLPSSSWVRMNKWSFFCAKWLNQRWQNSRWLPSSSWVRMNELESYWISLSQSQSGERMFLSVSERRWQGVWIQDGSVWIQDGRIQDGCHHQVESEWVKFFFVQNGWIKDSRILGYHYEVELENELNHSQRWQNSRWLPSSIWVRITWVKFIFVQMTESKMAEFKMAAIIKLSQNEWVWVRLN